MYTTATSTREQVLKAVAASRRAMKRQECSKSQFKFMCFSCGEMINRGDKITRCMKATAGMTLRYRGAGHECGLTMDESAFYLGETGNNMWVHIGCNPCYWDSLPEDSNEYSPPALRAIPTLWGDKVSSEFADMAEKYEGVNIMGISYYCMANGYPWSNRKFMKDRIIRAVTRFQALWRGYIYKRVYPIARRQARATEAINETGRATLSIPPLCIQNSRKREQEETALAYRKVWHAREDKELAAQNARKRNYFFLNNSIGAHVEVLFNENHPSATLYSGEVIKIQGQGGDGLYFWVQYHHDHEVRRYHWKRLMCLKLECEAFKSKHGILAQIIGKLPLYNFIYP